MHMKFRSLLLVIFMIAAISLSVFAILTPHSEAEAAEIVSTSESGYFLKLENNVISVYKDGETIKTGIAVPELRNQDRLNLENGIWVSSFEDILKLIEDFNS